jgi:hypothetical protein
MYRITPWSPDLNLDEFYAEATRKGFVNNSNQQAMVDCFKNEKEWGMWILYYNNIAVGSVGAHSIEEGYRICARTCVLTNLLPTNTLRTRNQIINHQHVTAQYLMPACIEWAPPWEDLYITSHPSEVGTQRLVHTIWGPSLEKTGVLTRAFEKEYRGHVQTFWRLNTNEFLKQLRNVSEYHPV